MRSRLARRAAAAAYRTSAAPLGRVAVRHAAARGLPSQLHGAFAYLFGARPPAGAREVASRIESQRRLVAARPERYGFEAADDDSGVRWVVEDSRGALSSDRLAHTVSVPARWGMFLHLCAEAFRATSILEVGTNVGISGAYLASASTQPSLLTLDGSADLARIARDTLRAVTDKATVVVGRFDRTLAAAVEPLRPDLAFVDGHHDGAATAAYLQLITPRLAVTSLVVLDDIRHNAGMWSTWQDLSSDPAVHAVDAGRFGLLVRDAAAVPGRTDLSRYTGWWPVGAPRAVSA